MTLGIPLKVGKARFFVMFFCITSTPNYIRCSLIQIRCVAQRAKLAASQFSIGRGGPRMSGPQGQTAWWRSRLHQSGEGRVHYKTHHSTLR